MDAGHSYDMISCLPGSVSEIPNYAPGTVIVICLPAAGQESTLMAVYILNAQVIKLH